MANQLAEFVRNRKRSAPIDSAGLKKRKREWLKALHALYGRIEEMLADSGCAGDVRVEKFEVELTEEFVGSYRAPALRIWIGNESVSLIPMGMMIVNAYGRVDLVGEAGRVTIVQHRPEIGLDWEIVLRRTPQWLSADLAPASLAEALDLVMLPRP